MPGSDMGHIGSGLDASRPRLAEKAVKSDSIRSRALSPSITAVGASMPLPRVILADDHTILLEALRKLLEPHCEIVGTVADGRTLLETASELKPDVIVADISMPLINGLNTRARLKKVLPRMKLIFLTMNEDPDLAAEALRCGASGYLSKTSAASELIRAIQLVLKGKSYVTPQIAKGMQQAFIHSPPGPKARAEALTARQREVMQLLARGKSMREVASILNVTKKTVEYHKYHIMEVLNLITNADFIRFAIESRILKP
jgi:DNA-binding NarL/FixJ family response regulator